MGLIVNRCNRCNAWLVYNDRGFMEEEEGGTVGPGFREHDVYGTLCPPCGDGRIPDGDVLEARIRALAPQRDVWATMGAEERRAEMQWYREHGVELPSWTLTDPLPVPKPHTLGDNEDLPF